MPTPLSTQGTYEITLTTTDVAGNSATQTYTIRIDKTLPTVGTVTKKLGSSSGSVYGGIWSGTEGANGATFTGNWTNQ